MSVPGSLLISRGHEGAGAGERCQPPVENLWRGARDHLLGMERAVSPSLGSQGAGKAHASLPH